MSMRLADLLDDREASGLELPLPGGRQGPGDPELEVAVEAGSAVAGLQPWLSLSAFAVHTP